MTTTPKLRSRALLAVGIALALALSACNGAQSTGPAAGGPSMSIVDYAFSPTTLTVSAGTRVTWTNTGQAAHTVTADDGSFDSHTLSPGATFSQTFSTAGTFAFHCAIHSSMTGTITVTP